MDFNIFLGSGIHFENEIPGVDDLTEDILYSDSYRHTDGRYFPLMNGNEDLGAAERADPYQNFLQLLKDLNDRYLNSGVISGESNYEDLYHLIELINREETGIINNLPVKRFSDHINKQVTKIKDRIEDFSGTIVTLLNNVV